MLLTIDEWTRGSANVLKCPVNVNATLSEQVEGDEDAEMKVWEGFDVMNKRSRRNRRVREFIILGL